MSNWIPPPSSGTTRARHRMRCGRRECWQRFTLKRHPDEYKRTVRCPSCGSLSVSSCEAERRRELARQTTCRCEAYPFPHRAGSLRFCNRNPELNFEPSTEDIHAYQACLSTPRSGYC